MGVVTLECCMTDQENINIFEIKYIIQFKD